MNARAWLAAAVLAAAAASRRRRSRRHRAPGRRRGASTRPSTRHRRNYLKRLLAGARERRRRARRADDFDPGRPARVDTGDDLRDPGVEGAGRHVRRALGRPGGLGRLLPPALGRRRRDGARARTPGAAHPVGGRGAGPPEDAEREGGTGRTRVRPHARRASAGATSTKAEAAVEKSVSYTETEARASRASSRSSPATSPDLVAQLDGRTVRRVGGAETTLALKGARVEARHMGRMEKHPRRRVAPQRRVRSLPARPRRPLLRAVDARGDPARRRRRRSRCCWRSTPSPCCRSTSRGSR